MPGAGAPPGAPGAPGGTGPATASHGMPGNQAHSLDKLTTAMKALQSALDGIPMGSGLHNEIITAISKIGKHLPQGGQGGDPSGMLQQLALMAREAKAQPNQQAALAGLMGGGGGGAPPPGAPPMPPPGGAPPPMMGA